MSRPVLVVRDPPPVELTDCQPEPEWPEGGFTDEAARYQWSAAAIWAGRDCRARLASLKAWALAAPTAK